MTENWVSGSIFCPSCGTYLNTFTHNRPVADFYCSNCFEEYELKASNGVLKNKIVDGAYSTMIERLNANNNPNFFFLTYEKNTYAVQNFLTIPKYFFVEDIIEKRKPLKNTAIRAGWIGCNIILNTIPDLGKIFFVQNGIVINKNDVLNKWKKTTFLRNNLDFDAKGWLFDTLICIQKIKEKEFDLEEVYKFEPFLKTKHPSNNNIQAKIRQQLQYLRDKNIIDFVGRGKYRMKLENL